jgi:glycerol-3-phosphate dehydrogenase (NAD(P)+)
VRPVAAAEIELGGVDLVVFAVPSGELPAAVGQHGARIGDRSAVLVVSKGLVPPLATTPSRYVHDRVRARAVAALGGTMHALEAVERGASVVLATEGSDFSRQLAEALESAGLEVECTDDVLGTELAGCAKNAAALAAAAAAEGEGMNAAGAAAGRVFAEVHELARRGGAREETFVGCAGVGDLVGTALADGSRNRRAGELIGRGVPKEQAKRMLNGAAEGLDFVPLLAEALERADVEAPATAGLRDLIEGRTTPRDWIQRVRGPKEEAAAA